MEEAQIAKHLAAIDDVGYTILENAIEQGLVEEILSEIQRIEALGDSAPRGNSVEGFNTLRTYNLLAKSPVFQKMAIHAEVLPLIEGVLEPECLLSGMTSMNLGAGEVAQPLHPDDVLIKMPRPHDPVVCTTIWALTDFSDENGGTRLVPGSHKFDHAPDYSREYESIPALMSAGSVLVFHGSLWHGSGENRSTDERRIGINVQYCSGFIRTQQNQYLGVPAEIARTFPDRLLELCGYTLYKGIGGHVDGQSPASVLGIERLADTAYASTRMYPQGEAAQS
jgi:ectoine hydroxylase-related dioxygenase (phytanoyl-CoA dioxygenase family)